MTDTPEIRKLVIELATLRDKLFLIQMTMRSLEQQIEAKRNPKPWIPPTTNPPK